MEASQIKGASLHKQILSNICKSLIESPLEEDLGLQSGLTGEAMLLLCYGKDSDNEYFYSAGLSKMEQVFKLIDEGYFYTTFCKGLAGICWGTLKMVEHGYLDVDADEFLDELDDFLIRSMLSDVHSGNYDFLHGASGIALYLTHRTKYKYDKIAPALIQFLSVLYENAQKGDANSLKWDTIISVDPFMLGSNISLSHGSSSLLVIISKIYQAGIAPELCEKLGDGIYNYIIAQRLEETYLPYCFPSFSKEGSPEYYGSRLAWCYGDLGISLSLWIAGENFKRNEWQKIAKEVALITTQRRSLNYTQVYDAGFCHGSVGLAYVYRFLYQKTGLVEFNDADLFWMQQTFDHARHPEGPGGYKMYGGTLKDEWLDSYSALEGIAGVGLVLAAPLLKSNFWDEMFLVR